MLVTIGLAWQSNAAPVVNLNGDEILFANQSLRAIGGETKAMMQGDGNFVIYQSFSGIGNTAVWSSNTVNKGAFAIMQRDGNFVVYNWTGTAVWNSRTGGFSGAQLRLQTDGNLVVYDISNVARWASRTVLPDCCDGNVCSNCTLGTANGSAKTSQFPGVDIPGGDYLRINMSSANQYICAYWCSQDASCGAYAYVKPGVQASNAVCYLKTGVTSFPRSSSVVVSGVVQRDAT